VMKSKAVKDPWAFPDKRVPLVRDLSLLDDAAG